MKILSLALVALVAVPVAASAQTDTTRRDSTKTTEPRVRREARGDVSLSTSATRFGSSRKNYGLSGEQARELQTALSSMGCDPGAVDGIVGTRTRAAMTCARQQRSISGTNVEELFSTLGLSFARPAQSPPMTPMRPDTTARRDTTEPITTPRRDTMTTRDSTTRRDSTARDSTMRDSTTRRDSTARKDTIPRDTTTRRDTTTSRTPTPLRLPR